jgi:hypothetical protein
MDQHCLNVLTLLEALSICECSVDANRMASMIQSIMQSNQSVLDSIPAAWVFSSLRSAVHNLRAKPMHDVLTLFQTSLKAYDPVVSTKEKIS